MSETVRVIRDNEIAQVILNRPEAFNSFDFEMIDAVARATVELAWANTVRGIVISGEGRAFCAGGDLKWVGNFPTGPGAAFHKLAASFHQMILEIRRMRKPVIAAVNGVAAGAGFSIALACDFRVMDETATLRQAYTSSGLCLDGAGSFTLPRLVGLARAMEIAAFDAPIPADKALSWGLVTKVVPQGKAVEEALNMAHELSQNSINSFAWAKQLLTDSYNTFFETQIEHERTGLSACAESPDGREGIKAFKEKRKPVFMQ